MTPSHILRTDGGGPIGFGHINRCLILADAIRQRGGRPEIVLGTVSEDAHAHVARAGHVYRQLSSSHIFDHDQTLQKADWAIFDFSHQSTRARIGDAENLLRKSRGRGARTMLIDAKGEECLSALTKMEVDILALPYAGAAAEKVQPGAKVDVRGLKYFVLAQAYLDNARTKLPVPERAEKILVTAGGSDPVGLTVFFLDVLERISIHLDIHIIVGPGFDPNLTATIETKAACMQHKTLLIHAPNNLAEEVFRADLALSASGLTKYELAFSGTPCVLVSIDENHDIANRPFAALGSCVDFGKLGGATTGDLLSEIEALLDDTARRRAFATAGPAAVDGQGTQRLLDLLYG